MLVCGLSMAKFVLINFLRLFARHHESYYAKATLLGCRGFSMLAELIVKATKIMMGQYAIFSGQTILQQIAETAIPFPASNRAIPLV